MISGIDFYWIFKPVPPAMWRILFTRLDDKALSFYYVTFLSFKNDALALASGGPQPF